MAVAHFVALLWHNVAQGTSFWQYKVYADIH